MSDGAALGIKLERLGAAQALLQTVGRWSQRARQMLDGAAEAAESPGSEVHVCCRVQRQCSGCAAAPRVTALQLSSFVCTPNTCMPMYVGNRDPTDPRVCNAPQQAPSLSDVVDLMEEAMDLGVAVAELRGLRDRVVLAEAWILGAREHARRFPPTSAQPPEALGAAQAIVQVRLQSMLPLRWLPALQLPQLPPHLLPVPTVSGCDLGTAWVCKE